MPAFAKFHGLGNDFIIVEATQWPPMSEALARSLCDRRRGVGADGVLVVHRDGGGRPRMAVHNADGSRPEMCGNGLRCVARYLTAEPSAVLTIQTGAGAMVAQVDGSMVQLTLAAPVDRGPRTVETSAGPLTGRFITTGNPHFVLFGDWPLALRAQLGPQIQADEQFPEGVNVSFASVRPDRDLDLWVYERGVGWTEACGTGACATAIAAWLEDRAAPGVLIHLPGGPLRLAGTLEAPTMYGAAVAVFEGDWAV